jgi:acyl carrier protein
MFISSRTPEGEPAVCPTCDSVVRVEPSLFFSDAPCPSCGCLLWFVRLGEQWLVVQPSETARKKGLAKVLSELAGVGDLQRPFGPETFAEMDLDSTEFLELVMDLEDELS